ncbi:hypothetical protein [Mesorhizobium sp.]|nr:hypothetical protein [Mesorhizobium sp.]
MRRTRPGNCRVFFGGGGVEQLALGGLRLAAALNEMLAVDK